MNLYKNTVYLKIYLKLEQVTFIGVYCNFSFFCVCDLECMILKIIKKSPFYSAVKTVSVIVLYIVTYVYSVWWENCANQKLFSQI